MISHNESLQDKLSHISRVLGDKVNQHHDNELRQLKEDFDWMVQHDIETESSYNKGYEQGHEDGYEEARDEIRSMI